MKSIKKELVRPLQSTLLIILLIAAARFQPGAQVSQDVLEYYWTQAGETFAKTYPGQAGLRYKLSTFNLYKKLSRGGAETITDSASIDYYYTGRTLDSQVVRQGSDKRFKPVLLAVPDIFAYSYFLAVFPNDVGRGPMAIGLDTDSADVTQPTGLLLIDRESYQMQNLFLYYEGFEDYVRLTRSLGFSSRDGYVVPDTAWIVASRPGVLSPEHFRIETDVTDFQIYD